MNIQINKSIIDWTKSYYNLSYATKMRYESFFADGFVTEYEMGNFCDDLNFINSTLIQITSLQRFKITVPTLIARLKNYRFIAHVYSLEQSLEYHEVQVYQLIIVC